MGANFSMDRAEYDNGWGEYANGVERNSESEKHAPRTAKNFFSSSTAANGKWDADFDRASYTNEWGSYREGKDRVSGSGMRSRRNNANLKSKLQQSASGGVVPLVDASNDAGVVVAPVMIVAPDSEKTLNDTDYAPDSRYSQTLGLLYHHQGTTQSLGAEQARSFTHGSQQF